MRRYFLSFIMFIGCTVAYAGDRSACPLFTFDFNMKGITIQDRASLLDRLGYSGLMFSMRKQTDLDKYYKYMSEPGFKSGDLSIPIVYFPYHFSARGDKEDERWMRALSVKSIQSLAVILVDRNGLASKGDARLLLGRMADKAKSLGKDIVIYPHDKTLIESAEEALEYIHHLERPNLFLSVHSSHELRAGNGNRLSEVVSAVSPYLKFATIAGSDSVMYSKGAGVWDDAIKPLDGGDYDMLIFLSALRSVGFNGNIYLHTFGLKEAPSDHLSRSIKKWKEWNKPCEVSHLRH